MATTSISLPNYREPLQDAQGNVSRSWWLFFQGLAKVVGGGQVPDLSTIIAVLTDLTKQVQDQAFELPDTGIHDLAVAVSELAGRLEGTQNVTKLQSKLDELESVIGALQQPAQNTPFVEAFTLPSLLNSWVNTVGRPVGYYKDPLGIVRMHGFPTSGVIGNAVFTLPAGYRPAAREFFPVVSNDLFGAAYVDGNGDVVAYKGSNAYFSLDGIAFRAAA
jgi:hypothetical protein